MRGSPAIYTVFLSGVLLAFFGGIYALWLTGYPEAYFAVVHGWSVDAWTHPFLDLTGVVSMGECHRLGIDVLKTNPCDPLHRTLNYGPPLIYLPFRTADTDVLGVAQGLMLLIAMIFVLRPRSRGEFAVALVASLSSAVLYEMERGNLDAVEFAIIALSGPLTIGSRAGRLASYALYYVGGVLKFYPFALLLTVLRERLMLALSLAVAGATLIGLYAFAYRHDFAAIGASLPPFEYDGDVFGAACLPFGVADWLGLPTAFGAGLMVALVAGFGIVAWRVARAVRAELRDADMSSLNFHYLLTGAVVLVGCFFLRPSITYRCIFLLLLLPGFWDLSRKPALRRIFAAAIGIALFCLWSELFRQWGDYGLDSLLDLIAPDRPDGGIWSAPYLMFFMARELLWWWLVAVMTAIIAVFVLDTPAMREGRQWLLSLIGRDRRASETA